MSLLSPLSAFAVPERAYAHFSVSAPFLTMLIWAICAGLAVGALAAFRQARVAGALVRALLAAEAFDAARAKTLGELGQNRPAVRMALARNRMLARFVRRADAENGENGTGQSAARYYIPEEDRYRAAVRFEAKDAGVLRLLLSLAILFAAGLLLIKLVPALLAAADAILS